MNKKGFTIVELIAVLTLMGIIITIAGVNVFKFRDRANIKALNTKIDNILTASELYVEKNSNDIVYKCENGVSSCICDEFSIVSANEKYNCMLKVQKLLDLGVYRENNKNSDSCIISNPTDETACLENKNISVEIFLNNNTAYAEMLD